MFGRATMPAPRIALGAILFVASAMQVAAQGGQALASALADQKNITTFMGLLKTHSDIFTNLPGATEGYTILAPTDSAFRKIQEWNMKPEADVRELLSYHILHKSISTGSITPGSSILANTLLSNTAYSNVTGGQYAIVTRQPDTVVITSGLGTRSTVVQANIAFDKGLVQVIDAVLDVPAKLEPTARDYFKDITAFVGALHHAGLADGVRDMANVTIFAPSNAAFQALGSTLTDMAKEDLARLLAYHIVPKTVQFAATMGNGTVLSSSLQAAKRQESSGSATKLTITRFNNDIFVNSAKMLQTDILIANGVVQMIDNVLSPDAAAAKPEYNSATQKAVITPSGTATAIGTGAPTPFASDLPCTKDCAVSRTQGATGAAKTSSTTNGVVRPTAMPMVGLAVGMGAVVGMEMVGVI